MAQNYHKIEDQSSFMQKKSPKLSCPCKIRIPTQYTRLKGIRYICRKHNKQYEKIFKTLGNCTAAKPFVYVLPSDNRSRAQSADKDS